MNSGKIVDDGWTGRVDRWTDRGSIRGPRGPKKKSSHKEDKKEEILASERVGPLKIVQEVLVELGIIVTR